MKYKEFIFEIYETAWKEDHCRLVRRSVLGIRHDEGVGGKPGRREQSGKENCADGRHRRFAAISMPCSAFTARRSKRQWIVCSPECENANSTLRSSSSARRMIPSVCGIAFCMVR